MESCEEAHELMADCRADAANTLEIHRVEKASLDARFTTQGEELDSFKKSLDDAKGEISTLEKQVSSISTDLQAKEVALADQVCAGEAAQRSHQRKFDEQLDAQKQ